MSNTKASKEGNAEFEELVRRELELLGEDPAREGLLRTPARVARALKWMTQGLAAVVQREATAQSRKASILAAQRARSRASSMPIHHAPIRQKPANLSAPHKAVS